MHLFPIIPIHNPQQIEVTVARQHGGIHILTAELSGQQLVVEPLEGAVGGSATVQVTADSSRLRGKCPAQGDLAIYFLGVKLDQRHRGEYLYEFHGIGDDYPSAGLVGQGDIAIRPGLKGIGFQLIPLLPVQLLVHQDSVGPTHVVDDVGNVCGTVCPLNPVCVNRICTGVGQIRCPDGGASRP